MNDRPGQSQERLDQAQTLVARNSAFYDPLWASTYLSRPENFNTWALISRLLPAAGRRLEIGPGLRPRLPVAGTQFIDISQPVVTKLNARGGRAQPGEITSLPFADESFDLIAAFDVVEHVEDHRQAFAELTRVLQRDGYLVFSVPLHAAHWNEFDDCVGHARRYEPAELRELLASHGLIVEQSASFGMQPKNPFLLRHAVQALTQHRVAAIRCYNWLFFPLGILLQRRLKFVTGLMDLTNVHEILLVCRREGGA